MPGNNWSPRIGLLAGVDWRAFAGATLFTRFLAPTTAPVALPALSATYSAIYEDALDALCGRGVEPGLTLDDDVSSQWSAAGTATMTLQSTDRFRISATAATFRVGFSAATADAWGGPAGGGTFDAAGGPPWTYDFPRDWRRDNVEQLSFLVDDWVVPYLVPSRPFRAQSPIAQLRSMTTPADADAQAPTTNLAWLDAEAIRTLPGLAGAGGVTWGLDSTGRVWAAWPDSWGISDPAWQSAAFAELLGFDGTETSVVVDGTLRVYTATHRCAYALLPRRQPTRILPGRTEETSAVRLLDGDLRAHRLSTWRTWDVEVVLDGTALAAADGFDEVDHFARRWLERASVGQRVALYQEWGETRRAQPTDVAAPGNYTALWTPERNGRRGRVRCRRSDVDEPSRVIGYEFDAELRSEVVALALDEVP